MSDDASLARNKQELYRDARFLDTYDEIWQSVNKCVFCDLNDKYVILEENGIVLTITLFAYIDGHCMIVPRRHIKSPKDLTQIEWETVRKFEYIAKKIIKDAYGIKGMQFVQKDGAAAQGTVEHHLHFHCIPFDAPDLLEWKYRKLQYTPVENVAIYRKARKKIIKTGAKFDAKYQQSRKFEIISDAIVLSTDNKILFQERKEEYKLSPDYIVLPGGGIDDPDRTLEEELVREITEETGANISAQSLQLVSSQIDGLNYVKKSEPLKATYALRRQFLRNTYLVRDFDRKNAPLAPADDTKALLWIDISKVSNHPRISDSTKEIIKKVLKND